MTNINELRQRIAVVGMPSDFGKPKNPFKKRETWSNFLDFLGEKKGPKDIPHRGIDPTHQRYNISNKPAREEAESILEDLRRDVEDTRSGVDTRKIPIERVNLEGFDPHDETGFSPENAKKWAKLKTRLARLYEP